MSYSYGLTLLILCPLIFLASFIDSIAGGGGLISLPAYMFAGIPVHFAGGTNKFSSSIGTSVAVVNYIRGKCIDYQAAIGGIAGALPGAWIGTRLALSLSPRILQICVMVILPAAGIFVLLRGKSGNPVRRNPIAGKLKIIASFFIGLIIGCYDGFFGPGTGMFLTLAFTAIAGLELAKAAGTARIINLSSNIMSLITWLVNGKVLFLIGLPCAACSVAGGFLGSRMAVKTGSKIIKPVLTVVAVLLFAKILWDLLAM